MPELLIEALEEDLAGIRSYMNALPNLKQHKKQTFWLHKDQKPRTAIEVAIKRLSKFANLGDTYLGAEWWTQQVDGGPGGKLGFHVDKDEGIASNQQYLVHSEYSSVFYLTDTGGGTLVLDQWSPNGNGYTPAIPEHAELIFPARNKYLLFKGELLHGVIPGEDTHGTSRQTFLINFWPRKPDAPNCLAGVYLYMYISLFLS